MGDAATPTLPDFTSQTASVYKANIDGGFAVLDRLAWAFAPHEQDVGSPQPDMTVRLEAGAIFDGTTLTEVAEQDTAVIAAPSADPRIDRVVIDRRSGAVSVVTGTEAASPAPPAVPAGTVPIAQVALAVSQTEIVNADLTDERDLTLLGLGDFARKNGGVEIKTANYTIQPSDDGKVIGLDGSFGDVTATLPATAAVHGAFSVRLKRIDDGSSSPTPMVKVVPDPGSPTEVIDAQQDFEFDDQNDAVDLARGASEWHVTASHDGAGSSFPAGTKMLFQQTAAPVGWTKDTTHDDKALRVVTGTVGSGGATAFSSVFGTPKTTGSASPGFASHSHTQRGHNAGSSNGTIGNDSRSDISNTGDAGSTVAAGSGSAHDHTLSLDLQFVDLIIATKD